MAADDTESAPFLGGAPASKAYEKASIPSRVPSALRNPRYLKIAAAITFVIALFVFLANSFGESVTNYFRGSGGRKDFGVQPRLHVLLPTTKKDLDFCKTTLSLTALGYPDPVLLGWEENYGKPAEDGGADINTKITKVVEYLEGLPKARNNDLVVVADAHNSLFQLKHSVLIDRYYRVNGHANGRLLRRLGRRAINRENIEQKILFGSSKTCTPNQIQSLACYPIPFGPIPMGLYGANTDTMIGENKHSSFRPRYLDSGIILGPVKDMRAMFKSAQELVEQMPRQPEWDNGSRSSYDLYGGSAQAIFNIVLGRQEYQREVIRQRHRTFFHKYNPEHVPGAVEGKHYKDIIKPTFTHETWKNFKGHPYEFGIGVDYWSELEHNTMNSGRDGQFLVFGDPVGLKAQVSNRNDFDCGLGRLPKQIPGDITLSGSPISEAVLIAGEPRGHSGLQSWEDVSLYTQLCLGSVPVMLHLNDETDNRKEVWDKMWFQPFSAKLMESAQSDGMGQSGSYEGYKAATTSLATGGAWTDKGVYKTWNSLCKKDYGNQLIDA